MGLTNKGKKEFSPYPVFIIIFLTKKKGTFTICDFNINNSNRLSWLCYGDKDWG